ncbi:MAG: 16S rRNA (cytosine(1402)-N(4))-methyltransferase RsmH [Clostridia bacterium]|nr:16S rRNA (cytosine(1402)-N(4))-methyltransferase RsmH [Clostridia bacterium]
MSSEEAGKENREFVHIPVLLNEVIEGLNINPRGIYIDGTAGGGGHSAAICEKLDGGRLIAVDQDAEAVAAAKARLAPFGSIATVVKENFLHLDRVLSGLGIERADGFLLDLGVSSRQLDSAERGFSYLKDAPLSMKMDSDAGFGAYDVVNGYPEEGLRRILRDWGEEQHAGRIARGIAEARKKAPIATTLELVKIIESSIPDGGRNRKHHPAMKTFQAIRIEVNHEIDILKPALERAVGLLAPGGRGCVITFHSVEDRAVKECFAGLAKGCVCPRDFPVCVCGRKPSVRLVSGKPVLPGPDEIKNNPRSHSAKLRIIEKLT